MSERERVRSEVLDRMREPLSAEYLAREKGWPSYVTVAETWDHLKNDGKWPITLAALWLAIRVPEEVEEQWARLAVWGQHIYRGLHQRWRDGITEAQENLEAAFRGGRLRAFGKIAPDQIGWQEIPRDDWQEGLTWETNKVRPSASTFGRKPRMYFDVRVEQDELRRWADAGPEQRAANQGDPIPQPPLAKVLEPLSAPMISAQVSVDELKLYWRKLPAEDPDFVKSTPSDKDLTLRAEKHFEPRCITRRVLQASWKSLIWKKRRGSRNR